MKGIETDVVYSIPTWAACYLYYGDKDGLSEEDIQMADDYVKHLDENGMRLIEPLKDTYDEFNPFPAFGKACSTEDWLVEILEEDEDEDDTDF